MKKINWVLISLFVFLSVFTLCIFGIAVYHITLNDIQVFDIANFFSTAVFSLATIGISVFEVAKQRAKDKEEEQKNIKIAAIRKNLSASIQEQAQQLEPIKKIHTAENIWDCATYSDVSLSEMCRLFSAFHFTDESSDAEESSLPLYSVVDEIYKYIENVKKVLSSTLITGDVLPESATALALSIYDSLNKIQTHCISFEYAAQTNHWSLLVIEKESFYGESELEKRKFLFNESCKLYESFNALLGNVLFNYEQLCILGKCI